MIYTVCPLVFDFSVLYSLDEIFLRMDILSSTFAALRFKMSPKWCCKSVKIACSPLLPVAAS